MKLAKVCKWAFFITAALNIFSEQIGNVPLMFITKPLLLILLAIYFYESIKTVQSHFTRFILLGFLFSVGGDTALMFVENPPYLANCFLLGLGSFLITHLCYAWAFHRYPKQNGLFLQANPIWVVPFLVFLVLNIYLMWNGLAAEMKIPVVVYSSVIVLMALSALNLKGQVPSVAFQWLFVGVLLFLVSDTIIGMNKFVYAGNFPAARFLIMFFYLLGQWLIAEGAIKIAHSFHKPAQS